MTDRVSPLTLYGWLFVQMSVHTSVKEMDLTVLILLLNCTCHQNKELNHYHKFHIAKV